MKREKEIDGIKVSLDFSEANGTLLNVATAGAGKPILLLHGWPFTWYVWHRILPGLVRAGFHVIAPDLRGIGESSRPAEGYDLVTQADEWADLLTKLDAQKVAVVGFDLGLQSALMLAFVTLPV